MQMRDSVISKGVITSPFIQKDIWEAIESAGHNRVNITKHKTPQSAEKYLVIGMFVWSVNIDNLKDSVTLF